jgi:hypothetical protein
MLFRVSCCFLPDFSDEFLLRQDLTTVPLFLKRGFGTMRFMANGVR